MPGNNFFFIYVFTLLGLFLLDSAATLYLSNNIQGGELNPLMDTESLWSILFSPVRLSILLICCALVWLGEKRREKMVHIIETYSAIKTIFVFPYVIALFVLFAVVNNLLIILGINGPISWFVGFFEDKTIGAIILFIFASFLFYPVSEIIFDRRHKAFLDGKETRDENL